MDKKIPFVFHEWYFLVRMSGLEPPTPCMSSKYSDQLSYTLVCSAMLSYIMSFVKRSKDLSLRVLRMTVHCRGAHRASVTTVQMPKSFQLNKASFLKRLSFISFHKRIIRRFSSLEEVSISSCGISKSIPKKESLYLYFLFPS